MDKFLHLIMCAGLIVLIKRCGFDVFTSILIVASISLGKELLDAACIFKPDGFMDLWDLIADGYGILFGIFIDECMEKK